MHPDLQKIFNLAIKRSRVDFGISQGYRDPELQLKYFKEGKSKVKFGKHNKKPAEAGDIYIYHANKSMRKKIVYDLVHLAYVGGIIDSCAKELKAKGEITHSVRWGANWDNDGVLMKDQSFQDLPHIELI